MKPGDLVRLKSGISSATGVAVSWTPPGGVALEVTRFDTGTPALLLQTDQRRAVSFILIGGRMGWVWPQELEPL